MRLTQGDSESFWLIVTTTSQSNIGINLFMTTVPIVMPAPKTTKPTEEEWLIQKPTLKKLWLEERKTTAAVIKAMERDNFHAK